MYIVFKNLEEWFQKDENLKRKFQNRYQTIWETAKQYAIHMNKMAEEKTNTSVKIEISELLLKQSLIDAFDDLLRLTNYHPTDTPNPIKEMSYIVYWMVRHKPIRLVTEDIVMDDRLTDIAKARFLFINENFGVKLLMGAAFKGKKEKDIFKKEEWKKINDDGKNQFTYYKQFLLYYIVYRMQSPKELETMLLGCTMFPIWDVDPLIWGSLGEPGQEV